MWEVDWAHPQTTGTFAWARNATSNIRSAREWHLVPTGNLRKLGVSTPVYRKDSWEVEWTKRHGKLVWARNIQSKIPSARGWHWVDFHQMERSGIAWKPVKQKTGRWIDANGYVVLSRRAMTEEEITLAQECRLWCGTKRAFVREHRLVAAKTVGPAIGSLVVRHLNGIKHDNHPSNLVVGTTQENTMDHNKARLMAMYWRTKYEDLVAKMAQKRSRQLALGIG